MNLRELSRHLGLSQTTVSRALNGYPEVSEKTRIRVVEAAQALNYSPNARAKALATGRALAIGHVIPVDLKSELVNPIFGEFIAGASEVYSANGYELVMKLADADSEEDVYRELKNKRAVDGVVVQAPRKDDRRIALLQDIGIPFVVHGRSTEAREPYSWIDIDNRMAFYRATKFLLDLGHERIALINGQEVLDFAYKRRLGFETALSEAGLGAEQELLFRGDLTEAYGYNAACQLFEADEPPTAVLVSSYIAAIGVRRAVKEYGLTMGREISVVIHDDELSYFFNNEDMPLFTATRSSVRTAGRRAAEILLDIIRDPASAPKAEKMTAVLSVGRSTGPATGKQTRMVSRS